MKIINPEVQACLEKGIPLKLELGSGGNKMDGFFSVDLLPIPGVDIVANLNEALDLIPDDSVSEIYSRHTFEHVEEFLSLLSEINRICSHDAKLKIIVPHFSNPYAFSDPTHGRFFGLFSFNILSTRPISL